MKTQKEELESIKQELNSRIDAVIKSIEKPKRVSGWYKNTNFPERLAYYDFENNKRYGFDFEGKWYLHNNTTCFIKSIDCTATPQEAQSALDKEAVKRYEGVEYVKDLCSDKKFKLSKEGCFAYDDSNGNGWYKGALVFQNGIWAEIVKQETIEELAKEFVSFYRSEENKPETTAKIFNVFLTTNKDKIINVLNNLPNEK